MLLLWRRDRDSNPGYLSVRRFSRPLQSTTLPPLQALSSKIVCKSDAKVQHFLNPPNNSDKKVKKTFFLLAMFAFVNLLSYLCKVMYKPYYMGFEASRKPVFIAGPCVIESMDVLETVAQELVRLNQRYNLDIIFKASFDKANRTSLNSFRGPGLEKGLQMLSDIKEKYGLKLLTDIHESYQASPVGEVVDVIQIPAFLCRQTDLLVAAAKTGKIVNIKKAQFLGGSDMKYPVQKVVDSGNDKVWLTERGNMYGYNNLVVDFRNIPDMHQWTSTVIMDCTHAVQRPGGGGGYTSGNREFVPMMALAAKAFGADGFFFEIHPNPESAKSDGPNMLFLKDFEKVIVSLL